MEIIFHENISVNNMFTILLQKTFASTNSKRLKQVNISLGFSILFLCTFFIISLFLQ